MNSEPGNLKMKTEAYLGLDLGGTGVKAGVFSRHGKLLAFGRRQFEPTVSREGHVDIPVETIGALTSANFFRLFRTARELADA